MSTDNNAGKNDAAAPPPPPSNLGLVLVTGGSRGIGRATSILLAQKGYDVAINYRSGASEAQSILDELNSNDGKVGQVITFQADVSKEEEVVSLYDAIHAEFGRYPTGLINNAGIIGTKADIADITTADVDEVFGVNVYGPFYCTREFVRRWKSEDKDPNQKGSIVNVSSGSAYIGNPLIYAMSKGALNSFMAGLCKTLPLLNIRMNAVSPGVTKTDMVSDEVIERVIPMIPMKRVGEAEEIAEGIAFLIGEGSSYCSGANIRMSGGRP